MPERLRRRSAYLLIGLNLLLMVVLVATLSYVAELREKVSATRVQQLSACGRGNVARVQINTNSAVIRAFLAAAAQTREQQSDLAEERGLTSEANVNRDAATEYRLLIGALNVLPLVDCEQIIR